MSNTIKFLLSIAGVFISYYLLSDVIVDLITYNRAMIIPITLVTLFIGAVSYRYYKNNVFILLISLFTLQSCSHAKSNQQVVVSDDCGKSWVEIKAGNSIPKAGVNPCFMKVIIPNYPMQGEMTFVSNLKDKVKAKVIIDYDYSIVKPLSFIKQAKSLGRTNADTDDEESIGKSFESAENAVIEVRIKDIAKDLLVNEDIVDLDQSSIESKLLLLSNNVLSELGIKLNFITLTFELDSATKEAIDVTTAIKIYESKGLKIVGESIMIERAGANKTIINNYHQSK